MIKDKTGIRVGKLTVIRRFEKPDSRYIFWVCRCDCGKEVIRAAGNLNPGRRFNSSCGCFNKNVLIDLTGQRFTRLQVLEKDTTKSKVAYWKCKCDCGKEMSVRSQLLRNGTIKSCGCYCKDIHRTRDRTKSAQWKGGITMMKGYRLILRPDHSNANDRGYVREHVYVMSQHLGRPLLKGENVHHKDGDRANNDISNLELWSVVHPAGQRAKDLVSAAWKIIDQYDPEHKREFVYPTVHNNLSSQSSDNLPATS